MRGLVPGLVSPHPIGETLPWLLAGDAFVQKLCEGLDGVLAPVFATLDALPAYLDPDTTPEDMLDWLASWIGLSLDAGQSPARRREVVRAGAELLPWRGTVRCVREAVRAVTEYTPEIEDSGSAAWSTTAGAPLPGALIPQLVVRLRVPDPDAIDLRRLDAVVAAVKPAHVPHLVEVHRRT